MKAFFLLLATMSFADKYDPYLGQHDVRDAIMAACAETGVPIYIAAGLQYSEYKPHDKERGDSRGWWQLNTTFHAYYRDRFNGGREFSEYDPVASTFVALRYLAHLHRQRGTWWGAIVDYKTGPNRKIPAPEWVVKLCKAIADGSTQWWIGDAARTKP